MEEKSNVITNLMALCGAVVAEFYGHLAPWLLLGVVLVFVDLRFGIKAAKRRGEVIRTSRAWRRTINKMVDYFCWVTLAEVVARTFGVAIGVPLVSMSVLFIIYGIELSSSVNNYLEYKGIKKKFNFFKLIGKEHLLEDKDEEEAEGSNFEDELKT